MEEERAKVVCGGTLPGLGQRCNLNEFKFKITYSSNSKKMLKCETTESKRKTTLKQSVFFFLVGMSLVGVVTWLFAFLLYLIRGGS